ncbi:MAG TPA: CBS domain-containing protein, partial [Methylothermaceae bacterium]|nr:CBS domain-containing protein [Methylothermaceae bacterium]
RLQSFLTPSAGLETTKPEVAGHLMTKPVIAVREDQPLMEILPLFSRHGFHHLPVVDQDKRLVGIISEHDLVQLLEMALQAGVSH